MDISDLQASLDGVRSWRKIELTHARSIAERHRDSAEERYLCRVWIMMIYAHCDQALKVIAKEYLTFLHANPRQAYNYNTVWIAFFGKEAIRQNSSDRFLLLNDNSNASNICRLENVKNGKEVFSSVNFSYSSLRFFTEMILQLPFDHGVYSVFCTTLKKKRDSIAHGEQEYINSIDDCMLWHEPAIELIDALVEATIDVASRH